MMKEVRLLLAKVHWIVVAYLTVYLVLEIAYWVLTYVGGVPAEAVRAARDMVLRFGAASYGFQRVWAWHPASRPHYRRWLTLTPWNGKMPLPVGPVHLVWSDALVPLALTGLGIYQAHFSPWYIPLMYLVGYLAALALTFVPAGLWLYAYGLPAGLGLVALQWDNWWLAAALLAVLYACGYVGLHRALAELPYNLDRYDERKWGLFTGDPLAALLPSRWLGWSIDSLRPGHENLDVSFFHATIWSLLAGWAFYVAIVTGVALGAIEAEREAAQTSAGIEAETSMSPGDVARMRATVQRRESGRVNEGVKGTSLLVTAYLGIFLAAWWRLGRYCGGHRWPISLFGRLATGRLIIPGYDRVFIAPLCIAALWYVELRLLIANSVSSVYFGPLTVTLMLLTALKMPPTLENFRLTSPARLVPYPNSKNKRLFVEI